MSKRRHKRNKLPTQPIELEIERLSHEGRGIANIEGKIAFVAGALAGEKVMATYVHKRSKFVELATTQVLSPAPDRVEPDCAFATICGGCSLQHMAPQAQIDFKKSVLFEKLEHATGLDKSTIGEIPTLTANAYHYRKKARLAVRYVTKKETALVGFREKNSSFITVMDNCSVLVKEVADLIDPLRVLISGLTSRFHIPQIEVAVGEDDAGKNRVALVIRHLEALSDSDRQALCDFAESHDFELYLQSGGLDTVSKLWPADGKERLQYLLPDYDLVMQFHPMDFTQINGEINRQMIPLAIKLLDLQSDDVVLDLFCGLGNFTLPMARSCKQVVGVEGSGEMVKRGYENAKLNGLTNADFYEANLCDDFTNQLWAQTKYSKILIDPPRSGAIEIIDQLAALKAETIVYISCNPATLARDSARLIECGYSLERSGVMDMFPHTAHVESIAQFNLKPKKK